MLDFNTHPGRYRHWKLSFDGPIARLEMAVAPDQPHAPGYELKLNSYDLGVDIELADAIARIRFGHPQTKVVVVSSANDRVFCAGANIRMLASSSHPFKVNFCKFTNETRLSIEDASAHSGIKFLAAVNGTCAGGGYELALACDEIHLVDDNNSAVSLPEVPLLGVLPGTGGLTRLVDKRKVRRDRADVFATLAEGLRGKKAAAWGLVDATWPKSRFADEVRKRAAELAASLPGKGDARAGIELSRIEPEISEGRREYRYVTLSTDRQRRVAELTVRGPQGEQPVTGEEYLRAGDQAWALRWLRELDDALCHLRFSHEDVNVVLLRARGDMDAILTVEKNLRAHRGHWLINEIVLLLARVLRRYELTARTFFALVDAESAFAGAFLEVALAGDRIYVLDDPSGAETMAVGPLSAGLLPMSNGMTRLQSRFLADPERGEELASEQPRLSGAQADERGLATVLVEPVDWEDEIRVAIEERASLSPDALTGMEASLRFAGAETCESKIFGRLSAWQNWIFTRPNATGDEGALVRYGKPEPARFDWRRT
jgi:benzoyl-CoA-dihydrodiol lyase